MRKITRPRPGMTYFPLDTFEKLQKRAERNVRSISSEILSIVQEQLRRDEELEKYAMAGVHS